ncbi:ROK family transcriptional regulator [Bacillus sp. FJAT-44742]|uniref:ROK family transcriptional regulator n=1 Tax=Bacillus sp. FJAT-44742 TaxID=2014005 RepID=UPI000C24A21C|nr:ROK family transcriptional regulator [Bacillus sp. FJAT-44742]
MKTGDHSLVKKINKSIVLNKIQNNSPISRAQISKLTGLNKATVSSLVSELLEEQFVQEIGSGISSGGRKPVMLYFNKNAGFSIGIDLGVNYALAILTDLQGNILEREEITITDKEPAAVFQQLKSLIESIGVKSPDSPYGIIGIGVGVPGIINNEGRILFAPNLDWHGVHLKEYLEEHFNVPITIENEANAGAHGEKIYGGGRDSSNLIYVSIGVGIGAGVVIRDQLYRGALGISGEVGHFTIESNGKRCECGNKGCWELYSSESAIINRLNPHFSDEELTLEVLIKKAQQGNMEVINTFSQVGEFVGIGLANIINSFNPEQIIIGNRFSKLEKWLQNPIKLVLQQRLLPYFYETTSVTFSNQGIYSCALGSSAFAIERFLSANKVTVV